MLERLFHTLKTFFTHVDAEHTWVSTVLMIFVILGAIVAIALIIMLYIRTTKEMKKLKKEKRKRDKAVLKFLSNKKNKTF